MPVRWCAGAPTCSSAGPRPTRGAVHLLQPGQRADGGCCGGNGPDRGSPRWFQLYWSVDEDLVDSFLARAKAMGASAIAVTLDTTMLGWRPQFLNLGSLPFMPRASTSTPPAPRSATSSPGGSRRWSTSRNPGHAVRTFVSIARNIPGPFLKNLTAPESMESVQTFLSIYSRPSLNWDDIAGLRERTDLPIVLKGILHPDDAERSTQGSTASSCPTTGVVRIDGSIGAIDALAIAPVVDGRIKVLVDSEIHTGADADKALALGYPTPRASAARTYGLAIDGADGAGCGPQHHRRARPHAGSVGAHSGHRPGSECPVGECN